MCSYSSRHSGAAAPCETKPARLSRVFCVGEADAFGSSFCRRSGRFRELIAELAQNCFRKTRSIFFRASADFFFRTSVDFFSEQAQNIFQNFSSGICWLCFQLWTCELVPRTLRSLVFAGFYFKLILCSLSSIWNVLVGWACCEVVCIFRWGEWEILALDFGV